MAEFLSMGGYAAFIWPAYAIAVGAIGGIVVLTFVQLRRVRRALDDIENGA